MGTKSWQGNFLLLLGPIYSCSGSGERNVGGNIRCHFPLYCQSLLSDKYIDKYKYKDKDKVWREERGREYPLSFSSLFPSEPPVRAAQFESLNSFLGFRKHWDSQWERGCVQCDLPICFCLLELCFLLWFLIREEFSCLLWRLMCNGLKCLGRLFPLVGSLIRWSDNQARICSYLSLILSRTSVLFVAFLNMELLLVRLWHRKAWNIQTVCCGTWLVGWAAI